MRVKCRIWWPKEIAIDASSSSNYFLFGWFVDSNPFSLDVVVVFMHHDLSVLSCQSRLQGILRDTNENMPSFLQEKSLFRLLGDCSSYCGGNDKLSNDGIVKDSWKKPSCHFIASDTNGQGILGETYNMMNCGCQQLNGLVEQFWQDSIESKQWIRMSYDSHAHCGGDFHFIPRLHHIHWNRQIISQCDVHVIVYETPTYRVHHFSLNSWNSCEQVKVPPKKLKWINKCQKEPLELDTVISAINSAAAAKILVETHMGINKYTGISFISMSLTIMWKVVAIFVASTSTILYIFAQLFYNFSLCGSRLMCTTFTRVFSTTWRIIQFRFWQILYWPVFLQDHGFRSHSCVEYAEKAALLRHSIWSRIAVDLLLGNLFGFILLHHQESACLVLKTFADDITNEFLRSGCVWLMGVPAGFKLNTELAGVLGMISLNIIQVWSTVWILIGWLTIHFIKGLALFGILLGATVPAALIIDLISLATLHVSTIYWGVSLIYSWQIKALAALWRLFRGRKWNPLRQRLDSYDYTVKQHIVGSLLFTPLLLLLPTVSAFYIFFTILKTTVTYFCLLIEVAISVIHCIPFFEIFLLLVRQRRLPSGIWFKMIYCKSDSSGFVYFDEGSSFEESMQNKGGSKIGSSILVSVVHSNFLTFGQVVLPHCKKVFSGISSFVAAAAYGALTGCRIPSSLGINIPSTMPWMSIPELPHPWTLGVRLGVSVLCK
ncbi:hypothetical protein K2173_017476 [Erythroxylum novogranatense]|uniref:Uncharacterized protein n=1 Tax=Erythroxylum novogranatense TaxID=1862640 RepID=A0AAV8TKT9_9ROSI|nr:hypothetical protein K2173_017476 [Erythroxylum novogranatense]